MIGRVSTATLAPRTPGGLLLRALLAIVGLFLAAVLVMVVGARVPARTPGPEWVRGPAMSVARTRGVVFVAPARAFVVDTGRATPLALFARSPQLGETIEHCRTSGWFEDPMHGSKFDQLGRYALGPAPRGLDRLPVRVLDGVVWIDTSQILLGPPRGTPITDPEGPFCVRS